MSRRIGKQKKFKLTPRAAAFQKRRKTPPMTPEEIRDVIEGRIKL